MANSNSGDRLAQIEALLQQSVIASDQRMTRLEQAMERDRQESNERMTRFESGLERIEAGLEETRQLVHSNNRFLESFSQDLRKYTESMHNLATRIDGVIATSNQDRQQTNSRLAVIERMVRAIITHLGVPQ